MNLWLSPEVVQVEVIFVTRMSELQLGMDKLLLETLRLTGRQVDISLPSILSFSTHPINLSLFPVSLNISQLLVFFLLFLVRTIKDRST